jgi:hypothetical protein
MFKVVFACPSLLVALGGQFSQANAINNNQTGQSSI